MASAGISEQTFTKNLGRELEAIVGAQYVLTSTPAAVTPEGKNKKKRKKKPPKKAQEAKAAADLSQFAIDGVIPAAVVSPASAEEIASILRLAANNDYVVVPCGALTKKEFGAPPERVDILLKTDRMNKMLHYDAGDLTVGVGAGMTIAELQSILAKNFQFLPLDPMLPDRATVGGVLAANANGPMRSGFGGLRDYCIGIHFVTGDGKIAKGGGKVVKNVAGYDLMKLMIGSMGTLGVITSANFKVFPLSKQTCTFFCECADLAAATVLRDRIIASPLAPMCLEMVSPRAHEYLSGKTDVRNPDHYAPLKSMDRGPAWTVALRAGGSDGILKRHRSELGEAVTRELQGKDESNFWRRLADFEDAVTVRHRNAMVVNVSVSPSSVTQAYEAAEQSAVEHNLLSACVGRAAIGSLVFAFVPLGVDPPSAMQFANAASSLRGRLPKGSSAVVVRCPRESKQRFDVWGSTTNDLEIMRGVRNTMDPNKILNRGRFIV